MRRTRQREFTSDEPEKALIKPAEHYFAGRNSNSKKMKYTEDMLHNPKMTTKLADTNYIKPEDERLGFLRKLTCGFHVRPILCSAGLIMSKRNCHAAIKNENFFQGSFEYKFMCLEWPLNVLQELVPEDKIRLLDWLAWP